MWYEEEDECKKGERETKKETNGETDRQTNRLIALGPRRRFTHLDLGLICKNSSFGLQ